MSLRDRIVPPEALRWGFLDGYLPEAPEGMAWGGWASRNYGAVQCGPPIEWPHLELAPAVYHFGEPYVPRGPTGIPIDDSYKPDEDLLT